MENRFELPPAVKAFVANRIDSVEELRLLVVLMERPERWWDAVAVSDATGIHQSRAGRALDRFVSLNLLDVRVSDEVRYRYRPATAALHAAAAAVADLYRQHPRFIAEVVARSAQGHGSGTLRRPGDDAR